MGRIKMKKSKAALEKELADLEKQYNKLLRKSSFSGWALISKMEILERKIYELNNS
jgi:hypothetical protein